MSGLPPPSVAITTAFKWRSASMVIHTSVVAKVTVQLGAEGRAALIAPDAFITFDRVGADPGGLAEVSELSPWTSLASVVAYGGPLRFMLESAAGQLVVTALHGAPAGSSMSSPERSRYAPAMPARGADGLLIIGDDTDGRFFVGAPPSQQLPLLRGDERFLLETAGFRAKRALPGLATAVTLAVGGRQRVVVLTPDLVSVHGGLRRVSLVSRATVVGDAVVVSHSVLPLGQAHHLDHGDGAAVRAAHTFEGRKVQPATKELNAAELARSAAAAVPFAGETVPLVDAGQPRLPATPFDRGFSQANVTPGVGVASTLGPGEELDSSALLARVALRRESLGQAPLPPPPPIAASEPAPPQEKKMEESARVAPPKVGAMAKPRFKRR